LSLFSITTDIQSKGYSCALDLGWLSPSEEKLVFIVPCPRRTI
jgi:hypothetical protein